MDTTRDKSPANEGRKGAWGKQIDKQVAKALGKTQPAPSATSGPSANATDATAKYDLAQAGLLASRPASSSAESALRRRLCAPGPGAQAAPFVIPKKRGRDATPTNTASASAGIDYCDGDATLPQGGGNKIIAHVCNNSGTWGKGFVLAISTRFGAAPKTRFQDWKSMRVSNSDEEQFALGAVQFVRVAETTWVANMIGQNGVQRQGAPPPVDYSAIRKALTRVAAVAKDCKASVHMPRIGTGLAGGDWALIEPIINETLVAEKVPVRVYVMPPPPATRGRAAQATPLPEHRQLIPGSRQDLGEKRQRSGPQEGVHGPLGERGKPAAQLRSAACNKAVHEPREERGHQRVGSGQAEPVHVQRGTPALHTRSSPRPSAADPAPRQGANPGKEPAATAAMLGAEGECARANARNRDEARAKLRQASAQQQLGKARGRGMVTVPTGPPAGQPSQIVRPDTPRDPGDDDEEDVDDGTLVNSRQRDAIRTAEDRQMQLALELSLGIRPQHPENVAAQKAYDASFAERMARNAPNADAALAARREHLSNLQEGKAELARRYQSLTDREQNLRQMKAQRTAQAMDNEQSSGSHHAPSPETARLIQLASRRAGLAEARSQHEATQAPGQSPQAQPFQPRQPTQRPQPNEPRPSSETPPPDTALTGKQRRELSGKTRMKHPGKAKRQRLRAATAREDAPHDGE